MKIPPTHAALVQTHMSFTGDHAIVVTATDNPKVMMLRLVGSHADVHIALGAADGYAKAIGAAIDAVNAGWHQSPKEAFQIRVEECLAHYAAKTPAQHGLIPETALLATRTPSPVALAATP